MVQNVYYRRTMHTTLSLDDLIALSQSRWAVPLLADLASRRGARFVELRHRLGLPRDSLVRALDGATSAGWLMRNPGHGHPLRPEYVLTAEGTRIAGRAVGLLATQNQLGLTPGALTRWGLPLVNIIGLGQARFNALAKALVIATPRAISQGLQALAANGLVEREVFNLQPRSSLYYLTSGGILLARAF